MKLHANAPLGPKGRAIMVRRVLEEAIDAHLELVLAAPVMVELERIFTGKLGFEPQRRQGVEELLLDLPVELVAMPAASPEA